MKRIVAILMVSLIAIMGIVAATSVTATGGSAEIPVSLDLSGGENSQNSIKVGLTANVDNIANENITELEDISLQLQSNNTAAPAGNVYVYWIIKGGQKLKVELSASGPLTDNTNNINWKVDWKSVGAGGTSSDQSFGGTNVYEGDNGKTDYTYTTDCVVFDRTSPQTSVERGSAALTIKTQDISGSVPANYKANLVLKVTADSSSGN